MPQKASIESLYHRYLANELNEEELQQFLSALNDPENELLVSTLMDGTWKEMFGEKEYGIGNKEYGGRVRRMKPWRWVAAASIILVLGVGGYLFFSNNKTAQQGKEQVAKTNDVEAPTETRAVITLADGTKVYLDSAGNGTIAQENNVAVVKNAEGEIEYRGQKSDVGGEIAYNTLSNPRGSKVISLTLSDGTKVWLNSESSLKYPIAFNAKTREVEITGEAYFEVKHNIKQPFKVHLPNGSIVEDLGTAFNINAYNDEKDIKATLIEGVVNVLPTASAVGTRLKPGQQAVLNQANPTISRIEVQTADVDEVMSWKNGKFSYSNQDLPTIMRQMARWYDVEVEYKNPINDRYTVDVPRTVPVSQLFKFIEMSGGVHFKIEGKKITVTK